MTTGLALGAKISAITLLPLLILYGTIYGVIPVFRSIYRSYKEHKNTNDTPAKMKRTIYVHLLLLSIVLPFFLILSFRVSMPYLFTDDALFSFNPKVLNNWKELQAFNDPKAWFPPGVQWINTPKILYPLLQIIFLGLGIPFTILFGIACVWFIFQVKKHINLLFPLLLIASIFVYQGLQYGMNMRYFWGMYSAIAVIIGIFVANLFSNTAITKSKKHLSILLKSFVCLFFVTSLFWTIAYMSIYSQKNTRVAASEWIYTTIPPGAKLGYEHWDDPLPLNLLVGQNNSYTGVEFPMYNPDTPEKWQEIQKKLEDIDYLILSSNRVYGSMSSAPERFPETAAYYKKLFAEELPFKKIAEFVSRPTLPVPISSCIPIPFLNYGAINKTDNTECKGITFIDDYAEETWTVYDHPKVTIFKKIATQSL